MLNSQIAKCNELVPMYTLHSFLKSHGIYPEKICTTKHLQHLLRKIFYHGGAKSIRYVTGDGALRAHRRASVYVCVCVLGR